jgi:hypothetical protein
VDLAGLSTGGPGVGDGKDRGEDGMGELRVADSVAYAYPVVSAYPQMLGSAVMTNH